MVQEKIMPHRIKPSFDIYDGDDKYIFITYAHKDAKEVISDLERFSKLGINIFYDAGLPGGHNWLESIERRILNSEVFIPFLTPNTIESRFSVDEIGLAYRSNLKILPIYLKETKLKKGLDLAIGGEESIFKYEMHLEDYIKLYVREFKRLGLINASEKIEPTEKPNSIGNKLKNIFGIGKRVATPQTTEPPVELENNLDKYYEHMGTSSELFEHSIPNEKYRKNGYIYISYSHKDIGLVISEIERYMLDGYKIKFDKGLNYNNTNDRPKFFDLINGCSIFVVFLSKNSIDSNQVKMELKIAHTNNKIIIPIFIEKTELSSEFESVLKTTRFIDKYALNENQYINEYIDTFDNILIKK